MKIAVVGAGISGLGASIIVGTKHEVHLYESESRLGGHAHTVDLQTAVGPVSADVGFLVYNELNYPQLTAFFKYLGVDTVNSDMSLSIQSAGGFEWAGNNINSVFGQRSNLFRPSFYSMLWDILRFHREAKNNLELSRRHAWSLGELLRERKFSLNFSDNYLLPMGAAIWSTPEDKMLEYPADTFLQFFINHKLLQVAGRPQWKTVKGGSRHYVEKAKQKIAHLHLGEAVLAVENLGSEVLLSTKLGSEKFDKVILATHAPTSLSLLKNPKGAERELLNAFQVEKNRSSLHQDKALMPRRKRCWASWNAFASKQGPAVLTYFLNQLQPLGTEDHYFLTLNPNRKISGELANFSYDHPRFTREAIRMQRALKSIQGISNIYYAGAWTGYGFHEDGLSSAVRVGELLDCGAPWIV